MRKNHIAISAILLLTLFLVALTPKVSMVKADWNYSNWYAANLYTTNWLTDSTETAYVTHALNQIDGNFSQQWVHIYGIPYTPTYGQLENHGTSTTPSLVYGQIDNDNSYHWFSTVLYIGHGLEDRFYGYTSDPTNETYFPTVNETFYYGNSGTNILAHTQSSPTQQFVFNWVCSAGNAMWLTSNGNNTNSPSTWGAPYDWNPLYWSGQGNGADYTWIGFNASSPWLDDVMGNTNTHFGTWLENFYHLALSGGSTTIMNALDMASYEAGYSDWAGSILATGYTSFWQYNNGTDMYGLQKGCMTIGGDPTGEMLPTNIYQ